jgi:hypothetical protein
LNSFENLCVSATHRYVNTILSLHCCWGWGCLGGGGAGHRTGVNLIHGILGPRYFPHYLYGLFRISQPCQISGANLYVHLSFLLISPLFSLHLFLLTFSYSFSFSPLFSFFFPFFSNFLNVLLTSLYFFFHIPYFIIP